MKKETIPKEISDLKALDREVTARMKKDVPKHQKLDDEISAKLAEIKSEREQRNAQRKSNKKPI